MAPVLAGSLGAATSVRVPCDGVAADISKAKNRITKRVPNQGSPNRGGPTGVSQAVEAIPARSRIKRKDQKLPQGPDTLNT